MKLWVILSLSILLVGCAHQANLTPISPGLDEYIMFYDRSDVQIRMVKGTASEERIRIYEHGLN